MQVCKRPSGARGYLLKRFISWIYLRFADLLSLIISEEFADHFGRLKIFFFTISGALAGGAVQNITGVLANVDPNAWGRFTLDLFSNLLILTSGIAFAFLGRQHEDIQYVIDQFDNQSPRPSSHDIEERLDEEKKKRYLKVRIYFLTALVTLIIALACLFIVHFPQSQPLEVSMDCFPCSITLGERVNILWVAQGATQLFLEGSAVPASGSVLVDPQKSTTFHLLALGPSGEIEKTVLVQVTTPPSLTTIPEQIPSPTSMPNATTHPFPSQSPMPRSTVESSVSPTPTFTPTVQSFVFQTHISSGYACRKESAPKVLQATDSGVIASITGGDSCFRTRSTPGIKGVAAVQIG